MNFEQSVFIDESGSPVLNDECYAVCAVACNDDDLEHDQQQLDQIRESHSTGDELKSSGIGGNLKRRSAICKDLGSLKSKCIVLVIQKKHLSGEGGFAYKTSAYKYCQRRLFEKIYKGYNRIEVTIDTFGNTEFMEGFKVYIEKHFEPSIFNMNRTIKHSSPKETSMLQVSDFVSGTVRRHVQGDDDSSAFDLLRPILSVVEVWPRSKSSPRIEEESESLDLAIEHHCTNTAMELIDKERDVILREALQYLLYSSTGGADKFVYGDKLLSFLCEQGLIDESKDKQWLQHSVIAPLRDKGAPIAASREGYKIPRTQADLKAFVDFVSQKTLPYLKKVNNMRTSLSHGLGNKYDMLEESDDLKSLMASLSQNIV